MAFDYKKEYKELYQPKNQPAIVTVPAMNYVVVRGEGDPNEAGGSYEQAVGVLYAVAYTLKMSGKSGHKLQGFFDYVVPPLEGFWQQPGVAGVDYARKDTFLWISAIRLPDFVTPADLDWAVAEAGRKKRLDCGCAAFFSLDEGLCVQMLHRGPFDAEPESVALMDAYIAQQGYRNDFSDVRLHHEIYLSDPRKTAPETCRTVLRHPIAKL